MLHQHNFQIGFENFQDLSDIFPKPIFEQALPDQCPKFQPFKVVPNIQSIKVKTKKRWVSQYNFVCGYDQRDNTQQVGEGVPDNIIPN